MAFNSFNKINKNREDRDRDRDEIERMRELNSRVPLPGRRILLAFVFFSVCSVCFFFSSFVSFRSLLFLSSQVSGTLNGFFSLQQDHNMMGSKFAKCQISKTTFRHIHGLHRSDALAAQ